MFPATTRPAGQPASVTRTDPATRLSADGLGERWLVVDSVNGPVEIRKLKKEFLEARDFETRLRRRVDDLKAVRHPGLAPARSVEWIDGGEGLGVVSTHVPGRRLSEIINVARGPVFALEFIKQVTPAIFALQQARPGLAHGTLNMDRVLVSREGRLLVLDPALGSAVESLRLSPERLRRDVGIAIPDMPQPIGLDARLDVVQIGFVALSLLLGRRLNPEEFRAQVPSLLDQVPDASGPDAVDLRAWLERALQVTEHPFESAFDALEGLTPPAHATVVAFRPAAPETPTTSVPAVSDRPVTSQRVEPPVVATPRQETTPPVVPPTSEDAQLKTTSPVADSVPPRVATPSRVDTATATAPRRVEAMAAPTPSRTAAEPVERPRSRMRLGLLHWVAIVLSVLVSVEAAAIAGLLTARPSSPIVPTLTIVSPLHIVRPTAPPPPTDATGALANGQSPPPVPAPAAASAPPAVNADNGVSPADVAPARAAEGRVGGVKIASALEAQVFEGGSLVGSTSGPIALSGGPHDLEIVNEAVGLRVRQRVSVKSGQLTTLNIALPQGRVNVNAAPWASVWIDGSPAGDTPLANLSLPVGSHEFLFRHPQLGEQRLTAIVKADGVTRVSASFQR